jgi:hypothetical protein
MIKLLQKLCSAFHTFIEISTLVFFPEEESLTTENIKSSKEKIDNDSIENIVNRNIHKILLQEFDEMDIKINLCLEEIDDKLEIYNSRLNILEKKVNNLTKLIKMENKNHENYDYNDIKPYQDLTHPLNWQDEHITTESLRESDLIDVNISDNLKNNDYEILMRAYETSFAICDDEDDEDEEVEEVEEVEDNENNDEIAKEKLEAIVEDEDTELEEYEKLDSGEDLEEEIEVY